ncbi:FlgD immunoglobulin-like domain containing protein [Candidatus Kapabacteria bacterium]|nr:FlgD immunoglobulin-like domain containing protein [Candidatus Kapabacteria bacterium]
MNYNILKLTLAIVGLTLLTNTKALGNLSGEFNSPTITIVSDYDRLDFANADVSDYEASDFEDIAGFGDADDGYVKIKMKFDYDLAGVVTDEIWVSVNGFVTFVEPLNLPQNDSDGLFTNDAGRFQQYVIAPFWGDHYFRDINDAPLGYEPSDLLIQNSDDKLIIEWRNLNINDKTIPSSIGNFQLILYKSEFAFSRQGNIEFAYGLVNGGSGATVITDGAAIGVKAEGVDYINGLCWDPDDIACNPFASNRKSNAWQPSGGTNRRISVQVQPVPRVLQSWGDGDTDLSQGEGQRHFNLQQNRFVTYNDVRLILRSVVENKELDSALGNRAFHADVDHDGRFSRVDTVVWATNDQGAFINSAGELLLYRPDSDSDGIVDDFNGVTDDIDDGGGLQYIFYDNLVDFNANQNPQLPDAYIHLINTTLVEDIPIRSERYQDDLPDNISRINQIFFRADERDASLISAYLKAKVVSLPWRWDTVSNGKVTYAEKIANDITFGEAVDMNGIYRIPVYTNGIANDLVSSFFNFDADIKAVEITNNNDEFAQAEFENGNFVFIGTETYSSNEPFAYIYVETAKNEINVTNTRFNDENTANQTIVLNSSNESVVSMNATPTVFNPVNTNTTLNVNVPLEGYYTLNVYDIKGNLVNTIFKGNLNANNYEFKFNGQNTTGSYLPAGIYLYRLSGNEINISTKTVIQR